MALVKIGREMVSLADLTHESVEARLGVALHRV